MPNHRCAFLCVALVGLLSGCATTAPTTAPAAVTQPAATSPDGPERALKKGMTAEAVRAIMGEPAEIKPMQSPVGQAETWTYHRRTSGVTQQVQVGTRATALSAIGGDGQAHVTQTIEEPVFAQKVEIVDETISLLMFDGRLLEQKKSAQTRQEYK